MKVWAIAVDMFVDHACMDIVGSIHGGHGGPWGGVKDVEMMAEPPPHIE